MEIDVYKLLIRSRQAFKSRLNLVFVLLIVLKAIPVFKNFILLWSLKIFCVLWICAGVNKHLLMKYNDILFVFNKYNNR